MSACDEGALRARLLQRVHASAAAARQMHTVRRGDRTEQRPAAGVTLVELYRATGVALRPGQPQRCGLVTLAPGSRWHPPPFGPPAGLQRQWFVLSGAATIGAVGLAEHGFHAEDTGTGMAPAPLTSTVGATLLLREARAAGGALHPTPLTDPWQDHGPGIQRRVLWQRGGHAAMLYRAAAGAVVPSHGHRHDEECLLLEGELFLDDILMLPLDYQLAPAGTTHRNVSTEHGALLLAHGDFDLHVH
jgi:quercetin dioxygenase-like cupin family protein